MLTVLWQLLVKQKLKFALFIVSPSGILPLLRLISAQQPALFILFHFEQNLRCKNSNVYKIAGTGVILPHIKTKKAKKDNNAIIILFGTESEF